MGHAFVSHSSRDDAFVAQLRAELELRGLDVWADSRRLRGGDSLEPAVRQAIEEAVHFVAVLSPHAVNSPWVAKEIRCAQEEQLRRPALRLIPLLLDGIEPGALALWFGEEPMAVRVKIGPDGLQAALPEVLAALDLRLPTDPEPVGARAASPLADLVLLLSDPRLAGSPAARRAGATVTLTYRPADGSPAVQGRRRYDFTAPLGTADQEEITWYLESYPRWPSGVFRERAARLEAQLPVWGSQLYEASLANPAAQDALAGWEAASGTASRRFTVEVDPDLPEGSGSERQAEALEAATQLLGLPWELLHDGQGFLFQGAHAVRVRRRLPNRLPRQPLLTQPPLRVLLASPRPEDEVAAYIDHRASAQPLVEALAGLGELARVTLLSPATFPALAAELLRGRDAGEPYHVVHFDGHGVFDPRHGLGALCFEEPEDTEKLDRRRTKVIDAAEIAQVLRDHRVPLVFLDACQTAKARLDPTASVAGKLLEGGVASVAAMSHSVLVETARRLTAAFYRELVGGRRVGDAMLAGQRALQENSFRLRSIAGELHLADWFVPVLFQEDADPQLVAAVPAARVREAISQRRTLALGELPPSPAHSFVGRSRELLRAERLLARARYALLRGDGGEGKTTLACELARWLAATERFARGAFVSLERDGSARSVLFAFGRQLVPDYVGQAAADEERAVQLVERALADEPTLLVIDNVESVLPTPGQPAIGDEDETLNEILTLCRRLNGVAATRLLFTSREALPAPFDGNEVRIGRLDRSDAVRLVGLVLAEKGLAPGAADGGEAEADVEELVEAAGCHARSLVLLAPEVAASGVRRAGATMADLMSKLEARHPGDRERSLLASVELSLRRLPAETREKIRPLAVFQGGGHPIAIGMVLGLDMEKHEEVDLGRQLIGVGLAEPLANGYLRFDPALGAALESELGADDLAAATKRWAQAETVLAESLRQGRSSMPDVASALCHLDLPNLLAALDYAAAEGDEQETVMLATLLADLLSKSGRARALARVEDVMDKAAAKLGAWSHARYYAEQQRVQRLRDSGRSAEAIAAARELVNRAQAAGDAAYFEAAFDLASAHTFLGCALAEGGLSEEAVPWLEKARRDFTRLESSEYGEPARAMASFCLTVIADALLQLNRLDAAARAYEESIAIDEARHDPRDVAVGKGNLGVLRERQEKYPEALRAYVEALQTFERLGEPGSVATTWLNIGDVQMKMRDYAGAERAYQEALSLRIQIQDRAGEAACLGRLGNLSAATDRSEEALKFYRGAAERYTAAGNVLLEEFQRYSAARVLVQLQRFDEARPEILRAIECDATLGFEAQPWMTLLTLRDLEAAVGNAAAAAAARARAVQAYLAYRKAGGESSTGGAGAPLCAKVAAALKAGSSGALAAEFTQTRGRSDLPGYMQPLLRALLAVLAGSRDPTLADASDLDYDDAAELLLLLDTLAGKTG